MRNRTFKIVLAGVILLFAVLLALVFRPAGSAPPLPSPNGYDDLVAAAAAVPGDSDFYNYGQWSEDKLAQHLAVVSNVFQLLNAGLHKESRVPRVSENTTNNLEARMQRLSSFKRLSYVMAARSELAAKQGRTNEAIRFCLEGVQVSHAISRGGTIIEALVGFACESIAGIRPLSGLVNGLDAETAQQAARGLAELDAQAPTMPETLDTERAYARSQGFVGKAVAMLNQLGVGPQQATLKNFAAKWNAQVNQRRQLILQLARHAYELKHGNPPDSDEELVPEILTALPGTAGSGAGQASSRGNGGRE